MQTRYGNEIKPKTIDENGLITGYMPCFEEDRAYPISMLRMSSEELAMCDKLITAALVEGTLQTF